MLKSGLHPWLRLGWMHVQPRCTLGQVHALLTTKVNYNELRSSLQQGILGKVNRNYNNCGVNLQWKSLQQLQVSVLQPSGIRWLGTKSESASNRSPSVTTGYFALCTAGQSARRNSMLLILCKCWPESETRLMAAECMCTMWVRLLSIRSVTVRQWRLVAAHFQCLDVTVIVVCSLMC